MITAPAPTRNVAPMLAHGLSLQNPDGGFGARAGLPSTTEPTALMLLALSDADDRGATERTRAWLVATQTPEGGWPATSTTRAPSWTTSLAVLALGRSDATREETMRGAQWLLGQEGRRLNVSPSLLDRLLGREPVVPFDDSLVGWPWLVETFSWVEPTAYAVLALTAVRTRLAPGDAAARIDAARRMIVDRVCPDGGWNYGNSRVLGQGLWPYPDTTALALLALHGHPDAAVTTRSLDALERMLRDNESGLATALGILALGAYGRDVTALRTRLRERFMRTGFLGETRALAYALLALGDRERPFADATDA
ncbi:MAG: prenyltransferase/squalene oxidase repeat-containing protein [Candidatus Binatia bacterium]